MFFVYLPDSKTNIISKALGENAFSSALILISLYRYESALIMFLSSIEAFLSNIDKDPEGVDDRNIWPKLEELEKRFPKIKKEFGYYAETTESASKLMYDAINLRNIIAHAKSTNQTKAQAAKAISSAVLPMLQAIYKSLFEKELTGQFTDDRLKELFEIAFYLRKNGELKGSEWTQSLAPIAWGVQSIISPNFAPKYLWDEKGSEYDSSAQIVDSFYRMKSLLKLDDEILFCPTCYQHSVGLKFTVNSEEQLEIEKAHCVNCQLDLGDTRLDKLISQALFDTYLTENETRIRADFGLK